jgi:hypothetical protein
MYVPGLPDGIFSNRKSKSGYLPDELAMEDFDIFYGHLVYFMVIWYFFQFWFVMPRKIWQPW